MRKTPDFSLWLLAGCFVLFDVFSWVFLFRDENALTVIGKFYPGTFPFLEQTRNILLHWGLNSVATIAFGLLLFLAFYLYFRLLKEKLSTGKVIFFGLLFQAIVLFSYPVLSTDIFDYILTNRLAIVHRQNVWQTTPAAFPNDPFYGLASWQNQISPYGVVNQAVYLPAGLLSGNNLVQSVAAHKLLVLLFAVLTLVLLQKILSSNFNNRTGWGILLVFANPLFVIETAGSAHNIIITIFFMLFSYHLFRQNRLFSSGAISALAVHTKFAPIFLVAYILISLFSRRKFRSAALFLLPFVILNGLFFSVIGTAAISYLINILFSRPIYWQSLPQLIHRFYPQENILVLSIFVLLLTIQAIRVFWQRLDFTVAYVQTIVVYLLFFTNFYLNWYVLWVLAFAPLVPWGRLTRVIVLFCATSALGYPLYMLSLRFDHQNFLWPTLIYFFISGIPAVYSILDEKIFAKISN